MFPEIRFSVRYLVRNKLFTTLHIIGLTLGISVSLVILLFIKHELSFDQWHSKADRIYRINSTWKESTKEFNIYATPLPLADAVRVGLTGIETTTKVFPQYKSTISVTPDLVFSQDHILIVEPSFPDIFDINILQGDARALEKPYQALISQSTANKFFGDEDPLGKTFKYRSKYDINIAGVFQDLPGNTNLPCSILVSNVDDRTFIGNGDTWYFGGAEWTTLNAITFALIRPSANPTDIQSSLDQIANERINALSDSDGIRGSFSLQPLADIHLDASKFGGGPWVPAIDSKWLFIFGGIGFIVLFLACVNFINLATGQSIVRSKEAGIRKTIGSTRIQLILQFLMEPLLLIFFSGSVAVVIVVFSNEIIKELFGKSMNVLSLATPVSVIVMVITLLLTAVVAGWYPAWLIVRVKTVALLKPGMQSGIPGNSWLRKSLIVFQFSVSAILMTIVFVLARQVQFIKSKDLGFTKDDIVVVNLPDKSRAQSFVNAISAVPGVVETSLSRSGPMSDDHWWNTMGRIGAEEIESVCVINADEKFIKLYDLKLITGVIPSLSDTAGEIHQVVVNEKLLNSLGLGAPADAVGKRFNWAGVAEISGVIADFNSEPLHYGIAPALIYQDPEVYSQASVRVVDTEDAETMAKVKNIWTTEFPLEPYEPTFVSDQINKYYKTESATYTMFLTFACIAVLISCLGLLGLCVLGTVRRAKEISIRKVLGASVEKIVLLLSRHFLIPIVVACIVAVPVAWWCVERMLDFYAYRLALTWDLFGLPVGLLIGIALVTTIVQTVRAAVADPVKNLKSE
jgi:putative ABC transport system permease protein